MRILLSNDDGIHAPGLAVLEAIAARLSDDVTVVAPIEEQSGAGRALTLTRPVRLQQFGERRWAVTGTPSDAVTIALAEVMDASPDLLLSGVNRGGNMGEDVFYSGTVAAAMEGALAGIRSIALSQAYPADREGPVSFACAEAWADRVLAPLLASADWAPRSLVTVNFPPVAPGAVKGIRVVPQGLRDYGRVRFDKRRDPRGVDYYWLAMGRPAQTPGHRTDLETVEDGFISVTPLHLDLTHQPSLAMLEASYA